jgi:hypothetical protein
MWFCLFKKAAQDDQCFEKKLHAKSLTPYRRLHCELLGWFGFGGAK